MERINICHPHEHSNVWSNHIQWMLRKTPNTPNEVCDDEVHLTREENKPLRYRCRHCNTPIAFLQDEIPVDALGSHSIQVNPNGFVHEVITVRTTQNTISIGKPVPADSWFPGFCWRYLVCSECTEFVGWSYSRPLERIMIFAGLSRASITIDSST